MYNTACRSLRNFLWIVYCTGQKRVLRGERVSTSRTNCEKIDKKKKKEKEKEEQQVFEFKIFYRLVKLDLLSVVATKFCKKKKKKEKIQIRYKYDISLIGLERSQNFFHVDKDDEYGIVEYFLFVDRFFFSLFFFSLILPIIEILSIQHAEIQHTSTARVYIIRCVSRR